MNCPNCKDEKLKKAILYNTEIDYCPSCLGVWFDSDELKQFRDVKDKDLAWLDIDLWQDKTKFMINPTPKACPKCAVPLYEVVYGDSKIKVDVCNLCQGVFLDRGEFKKIIEYLKNESKDEILYNYFNTLIQKGIDVFKGPDDFKDDAKEFLAVLKLLNYKFVTHHPIITKAILMLPK